MITNDITQKQLMEEMHKARYTGSARSIPTLSRYTTSQHLHMFTTPEALWTHHLGFGKILHYTGTTDYFITTGD